MHWAIFENSSLRCTTYWAQVMLLGVALLAYGGKANAQSSCDQGIVRLPSGANGSVTICPALAAQVPQLQRQLAAILSAQTGQQEQSKELIRLLKNLNSVSRNIGESRQAELLKTLHAKLTAEQAVDPGEVTSQLTQLADGLESLRDLLLEKLGNQATAERANEAVRGGVGDAIAHLDLAKADTMLAGIQAQLNAIGSKIDDVHAQTTDIQKTLHQQQQEEARQRQAAQEEAAQLAKKANADPNAFAVVSMMSSNDELLVFIMPGGVTSPFTQRMHAPFSRPTLRVVLRDDNGRATLLAVTDRQTSIPELWRIKQDYLGKQVIACFAATDAESGNRREVVTKFTVGVKQRYRTPLVMEGDPIQVPVDDVSCDGVTTKTSVALVDTQTPPEAAQPKPALPHAGGPERVISHAEPQPTHLSTAQDAAVRVITGHPDYFVSLVLNAYLPQGTNAPWHVIVAGGGHSLTDTSLQVIVTHNAKSRRIDLPVPKVIDGPMKGGDVTVPEIGDQATVCFYARHEGFPNRMMWRKTYDIQVRPVRNIADFQAASVATLVVDTGDPCK